MTMIAVEDYWVNEALIELGVVTTLPIRMRTKRVRAILRQLYRQAIADERLAASLPKEAKP